MALTVSNLRVDNAGSMAMRRATIAFDTSYPTGGETLTAGQLGLSRIASLTPNQEAGYVIQTMYTSLEPTEVKLKVFRVNGVSVAGENDGESSHTHALSWTEEAAIAVGGNIGTIPVTPPATLFLVQHVYATAGGSTGPKLIVPQAIAPAAGEVSINQNTGLMVFNAADAVTSVSVVFAVSPTGPGSEHTHVWVGDNPSQATTLVEIPNAQNVSAALSAVEVLVFGYD